MRQRRGLYDSTIAERRALLRKIILMTIAALLLSGCAGAPLPVDTRHFAQNCPWSATNSSGGDPTPYNCLPGSRESRS